MTASAADRTTTEPSSTWRIAPSVPVAIGVFVAYIVVVIGLMATAGSAMPWPSNRISYKTTRH